MIVLDLDINKKSGWSGSGVDIIAYIYVSRGTEDKQTELLYCFPRVDIDFDKVQPGPWLTLTLPGEGSH